MKSNMTKHFQAKAKRGLCMAQGGLLDPQAQQTTQPVAPYTDFVERENAEKTARWRQDDQLSHGIAPQAVAGLGAALQPQQPQAQQSSQPAAAAPMYTDSLERENAEKTARWRQDSLLTGRGLRMAEGGMVPETAEQVMARMANKYGTTGAAQAAPVAQPAPAPAQVQQPAPQPKPTGGLFGRALGGLRQANEQLRQVTNYAEGGIVRGKGGPTDDEVPMNIGGTDVNLSNKEAVLPAKTVAALGGPEAVEELIEQTNGKPPVSKGLRQGGNYNRGGFIDDYGTLNEPSKFQKAPERAVLQQQLAAAEPAAQASPTGQTVRTGTVSPTAPVTQVQPSQTQLPRGEQFGRNAAKVYQGIGGVRGVGGKVLNAIVPAAAAFDTMGEAGIRVEGNREGDATNESAGGLTRVGNAAKEVGLRAGDWGTKGADMLMDLPLWALNKAGATSEGKPLEYGLINKNYRQGMRDAKLAGVTIPQSSPEREMTQVPTKPKLRFEDLPQASYSNEGRAKPQASVNPISTAERTLVDNTLGKDAAVPQGLRGRWADNDPMKAQQFVSNDNAATGLRNNPANGHGVVSIKQPDGSFKNVLMGPSEYTAADGSKTSDWSKTSQFTQGSEQAAKDKASLRDLQYQNAKFNATSDQITDPSVQAAGLRGLAQYDKEETTKAEVAKNKAAAENARIGHLLTEQGQRITLRGQDNMQENSAREAAAAKQEKRLSRYKQLLDMHAPTDGLKDDALLAAQGKRSDLQRAFESAATALKLSDMNDKDHETGVNQAVNQARLSIAVQQAMRKDKAGWNLNNIGRKANTTLGVGGLPAYSYDKDSDTLDIGGYRVKGKDVWGDDADLAAFAATRKSK